MPDQLPITEPFPIYHVSSRFLIYDVNVVSHIRRTHRMCGVLSGTLPMIPQQNVFLGLPLTLMTEEAALLVELDAAYIVDDPCAHRNGLQNILATDKSSYLTQREEESNAASLAHKQAAEEKRKAAWKGAGDPPPSTAPDVKFYSTSSASSRVYHASEPSTAVLPRPGKDAYAIYRSLQREGYFLSPGLRFGCQFMAYPGDPLRFHSHFVVRGVGWDEEIDVIDIVSGGRLGTGVKKGWMMGGENEDGAVRAFCVEWGGF